MSTCDVCAEPKDDCLPQGDANVCGDCRAFHERAIDAATHAVLELCVLTPNTAREVVGVAVKAYCEYGGQDHA